MCFYMNAVIYKNNKIDKKRQPINYFYIIGYLKCQM